MSEKVWKATAPGNDYHRCIETHEARESTPKTLKNDEILKYFLSSTEREKKKKKRDSNFIINLIVGWIDLIIFLLCTFGPCVCPQNNTTSLNFFLSFFFFLMMRGIFR
jgi:hydrogenase-4 membrane subunit HyfE